MLQAPSPTKATVSPASCRLCSRIVSRSASSWQGWKSSVSALTTGTPACVGHLLEVALRVGAPDDHRRLAAEHPGDVVRRTRARRCRRARRRRASGSRRARRCPAANDDWVRSVCLSKIIATVRGPASGLASYGACLSSAARSSTSGLLGRGQVVVARGSAEVRGAHASAPSPRRGSPARRRGTRRRRPR